MKERGLRAMSPRYPKYATDAKKKLIDARARNAPRAELARLEAVVKAQSRPAPTAPKVRKVEHKPSVVVDLERARLEREWQSAPEG
jgi:hypothetical protein